VRFVPAIGPSHIVDRKWSTTAGSLKSKSPGKGPFLCRNSPVLRTQSRPNSRLQAERTHKAYHRCQQENAFHLKPGGAGNRPSFYAVFVQKRMAPQVGLEPTTLRLTAGARDSAP
jgi:hypothetical protein